MPGKIEAICLSREKGTPKTKVPDGLLIVDFGLQGDAHAGNWHRQISLLSSEKIEEFKKKGAKVSPGDFGENLVISGLDQSSLIVGTRLSVGKTVLEITQLGKVCHKPCRIFETMGECIMPREGLFAKVITGGHIQDGNSVSIILPKSFPNCEHTPSTIDYQL